MVPNGACHRRQFRNCLVAKKLGVLQTGFVGFSYLDAEDRIPT